MKAVSKLRPWKTTAGSVSNPGTPTDEATTGALTPANLNNSTETNPAAASSVTADSSKELTRIDLLVKQRKEANDKLNAASTAMHSYLAKQKPLSFEPSARLTAELKAAAATTAEAQEEANGQDEDSNKAGNGGGASRFKSAATGLNTAFLAKFSKESHLPPIHSFGLALCDVGSSMSVDTSAANTSDTDAAATSSDELNGEGKEAGLSAASDTLGAQFSLLGTTHVQIAALQTQFAATMQQGLLSRFVRSKVTIEAYAAAKKKVEATGKTMRQVTAKKVQGKASEEELETAQDAQ